MCITINVTQMPVRPLSDLARESFYSYVIDGDIKRLKSIVDEITDPRDKTVAKYTLVEYYMTNSNVYEIKRLLAEIEKANVELNDDLVRFLSYLGYFLLYKFYNYDQTRVTQYSDLLEYTYENIEFQNEWEHNLINGAYNLVYKRLTFKDITKEDIKNRIYYGEKGLEFYAKLGEKGKDVVDSLKVVLGELYFRLGDFNKAKKLYEENIDVGNKYNSVWRPYNLSFLAWFNILIGNPKKAHFYNDEGLRISQELNLTSSLIDALSSKGQFFLLEGRYDEALESYLESYQHRLQLNQPGEIHRGYYDLFSYYYELFRVRNDPEHLKKATSYVEKMREFTNKHPVNDFILIRSQLAEASILKHGKFKDKARAEELLEDLMTNKLLPRREFLLTSINLLDLLFENLTLSSDPSLADQIEHIITKVEEMPLHTNVNATYHYVTQQILVSKYYYYLKNDVSLAIRTLTDLKERLRHYGMINLEQLAEKELTILTREKQKWEAIDLPLKQRIEAAEFQSYLKEALQMANRQPEQR
jgi:hypothetical protein